MKRTLAFSFYVFDGWKESFSNRIHIAYLKKYASIFNEAIFFIVADDVEAECIAELKHEIIDIGFTNVKFEVHKNTLYREAEPFYNGVAKKLGSFDGIVLWGHNKGVSNIYFYDEGIFSWLSTLYFGTMGLIEECEKKMIVDYYGGEKYFYGNPLIEASPDNNIGWIYGGAFFAMNPGSIVKHLKKTGTELPKLSNRSYVEEFPSAVASRQRLGSHINSFIYSKFSNFYDYSLSDWEECYNIIFEDIKNEFSEIKNEIWEDIKL